jgi:3-oxoacyl-[acyl-carrier-protein] synthase II
VAQRLDTSVRFALAAAREAVTDAGLSPDDWDSRRVAVVMGTCYAGVSSYEEQHRKLVEHRGKVSPMLIPLSVPNMIAAQISLELQAWGPSFVVSTACASGATAVGTGLHLLRAGLCDIVLAGGADAMITPLTARSLAAAGVLSRNPNPSTASRPFDIDRDGFVMGEGAAVLVLERLNEDVQRRRDPYALLAGYGASCDAHHPVAPHPDGRGAAQAVEAALLDARAHPGDVDHVNAHGTGTKLNDSVEAGILRPLLRPGTPVTSVKGAIGHTFGAAGAIEAAVTALSVHHQLVPPTAGLNRQDFADAITVVRHKPLRHRVGLALSNSFGFGGHNAVLVFRHTACVTTARPSPEPACR